jgi:hypothetical protein
LADLTLKRGDTYPPLSVTLSDASGAINLTNASAVHMEMKAAAGTLIASLGCTIASAPGGFIQHAWAASETAMVDTWSLEWEILWQTGGIQTVPNDGVKSLAIIADIEGT